MVSEVVSALMDIVNCPPLITAPSKKLIGALPVQVLAAAISLAAVVTWNVFATMLGLRCPICCFVDLGSSYYSLLCFICFCAHLTALYVLAEFHCH